MIEDFLKGNLDVLSMDPPFVMCGVRFTKISFNYFISTTETHAIDEERNV